MGLNPLYVLVAVSARRAAYNIDEDDRAYDELIGRGWWTRPVKIVGDRVLRASTWSRLGCVRGLAEALVTSVVATRAMLTKSESSA